MILIHAFFWTCVVVVGQSLYYWIQLIRGRLQVSRQGEPLPWWVWATFLGFGVLGITASAPGLFFDQPYWLTDKVFSALEKLIRLFVQ